MKTASIRILIADDHGLMRRGLRQLIDDEIADVEFGEAENSQQALELIWNHSWNLLVLDINMAGRNGFEVLDELKRKKPCLPVLVLSAYPEDQLGLRALESGAAGYVTKLTANKQLIEAIKKVMAGGKYVSPTLAEKMVDRLGKPTGETSHESLSPREYQVMQLLAAGKALKEIGHELSLSAKTVSTFRGRLLKKLGLQSNVELVRYALKHHLVE